MSLLFAQLLVQVQIIENVKALRHWPLCGKFTGDRWISRTKGQQRGKCFHLMTSLWRVNTASLVNRDKSTALYISYFSIKQTKARVIFIITKSVLIQKIRNEHHLGPTPLTWIYITPKWIINHTPSKVWVEITYPFPNVTSTDEVWK